MTAVIVTVVVVLLAVGLTFGRIAGWHTMESRYWARVSLVARIDQQVGEKFRPEFEWVQANPAPWTEKVRGWRSPVARMKSATQPTQENP